MMDSLVQALISFVSALFAPASFRNGEFEAKGPAIFVLLVTVTVLGLSIWSLVWIFLDARKRNKSGILALLFILLTGWPLSFVWWFWLRPGVTKK